MVGVKALERCLETRMDTSAIIFEIDFVPPFVPPLCLWHPLFGAGLLTLEGTPPSLNLRT